ncbi:hypothetical protein E2C01_052409 [Portunus trituberculatus]|uniref:Uncharacterized protein n=1 Tax=Portunus trituberculatus TaxID=210409 RepID=A0A5B7GP95_PORTR|nr:hypothetical protein [Portunus trituberculatus]
MQPALLPLTPPQRNEYPVCLSVRLPLCGVVRAFQPDGGPQVDVDSTVHVVMMLKQWYTRHVVKARNTHSGCSFRRRRLRKPAMPIYQCSNPFCVSDLYMK